MMTTKTITTIYLVLAALICLLSTIPIVNAVCDTTAPESCLYDWDECGSCDDAGAVTGCNQRATVHLTINNGPYDYWTSILDILAWKQVQATFFVDGAQINGASAPANAAAILNRILSEGHEIGCQSQTHAHFNLLSDVQLQTEIQSCLAAVRTATGFTPTLFRPPYGECNTNCMAQLDAAGLTVVYWNFDTNDYQDDMSVIATTVDKYPSPPADNSPVKRSILGVGKTTAPGLIMVMNMVDLMGVCALPVIIDRVRFEGWNFVTGNQCWGPASTSTTPIPVLVAPPTTDTPWPVCTVNGPIPTIPTSPGTEPSSTGMAEPASTGSNGGSDCDSLCNTDAPESCLFDWDVCGSCDDAGAVTGCNQRATVHLTIADGPNEWWSDVLDILAWKQVKATFFVDGSQIAGTTAPTNAAAILTRIVNEGHELGCQSMTHPHFNTLTATEMQSQIQGCLAAVNAVVGFHPILFRPPYGECNTICMDQAAVAGVTVVYWNFNTYDYQDNMALIETSVDKFPSPPADDTPVKRSILQVGKTTAPGLILNMNLPDLMGVCALPVIIDRVRFKGWNFVTGDQCYGDASTSTTPIPVLVAPPTTNTPWPDCTVNGPIPTIPTSPGTEPSSTGMTEPTSTGNNDCDSSSASQPGTEPSSTGESPSSSSSTGTDNTPCSANDVECDDNAVCVTSGANAPRCVCRAGFTGSGAPGSCVNVNECATNNGGCHAVATCTDVIPTAASGWAILRTCDCHAGYTGNGVTCTNVNECLVDNGGCCCGTVCNDYTPLPTNNWVTFSCDVCRTGYALPTGDSTTCEDINECQINNNGVGVCSPLVTCTNNAPTDSNPALYTCGPCPAGYTGDGTTCTEINECVNATTLCDDAATCTNTPGSYQCACRQGFIGDGTPGHCVNINECATNNGGCSTNPAVSCTDRTPRASSSWAIRFQCGACPTGYIGNGQTCTLNTSSSTGAQQVTGNNPSVLSGAATISAGIFVTLLVPFLAQFCLARS